MVISQAVPIGEELAGVSAAAAAGLLGTMSIFNGLGRPAFGWISDRIGRINSLVIAFSLYLVALMWILRPASCPAMYTVGISVIGFSYGGYLSLLPARTADCFGTKNIGVNYGLIFSAYGVAGIAGPLIGAWVRETTGGWENAFWIFSVLSVVGILLSLLSKLPSTQPKS